MYIEQGYEGNFSLWKFWILPLGFIGFMILNYISMLYSPVPVDVMMTDLIDKLGSNLVLILILVPLALGLFIVFGWVKLIQSQSIRALTTSRNKIDWKRIGFAFFLWGAITVLLTGVDVFFSPEKFQLNFQLVPFLKLAVIAILLIPLQTSFEEYMFRGHMMQGLGLLVKNRWFPLLVTSLLFGLMHLGNPEVSTLGPGIMIFYIGTGLFLGIITLMDEGLELALGFHAANNLFGALLVTADWTAFQTNSIYRDISSPVLGWDILVPVFVIFPLLLYFFARKYGWKNWKERLTGKVATREEFLESQANG
ncbi:CPBP family intramembrane glutamic endopeptidase [uncultured Muriicola sp.]|uniref:CPBP family intramembrane glutamic endopeptidase n=1 Tax=uncultured Muriicola sp. TaxID=1583102 RepID=UPI002620E160|nr:CPBP family intramembrane glutamic endopeptidase [uncultured Muriicola sp.]